VGEVARAAHVDRADERVTIVEPALPRLEPPPLERPAFQAPAGVERREDNGVAGIDRQHGLEARREVAVERAPLERQLLDGH